MTNGEEGRSQRIEKMPQRTAVWQLILEFRIKEENIGGFHETHWGDRKQRGEISGVG